MRLLFVCSGNTCRSPLAVAAWHSWVPGLARDWEPGAALALQRVTPASAGLSARTGESAARHSINIAREWGVDLTEHRARLLMPQVVAESDFIVTMTGDQAELVREHFGVDPHQVKVLGSYAPANASVEEAARLDPLWGRDPVGGFIAQMGGRNDILDPFGGSQEAYQACANQIRRCVLELARALAGKK